MILKTGLAFSIFFNKSRIAENPAGILTSFPNQKPNYKSVSFRVNVYCEEKRYLV